MEHKHTQFLGESSYLVNILIWFTSGSLVGAICMFTVYLHNSAMLVYTQPKHVLDQVVTTTDDRLINSQIVEQHEAKRRTDRTKKSSIQAAEAPVLAPQEIPVPSEFKPNLINSVDTSSIASEHDSAPPAELPKVHPPKTERPIQIIEPALEFKKTHSSSVQSSDVITSSSKSNEHQSSSQVIEAQFFEAQSSSSVEIHTQPDAPVIENRKPAASELPVVDDVIHPVNQVPNWGAMTVPKEWNRTYDNIPEDEYVPVPTYSLRDLTIPMEKLLRDREANEAIITAKLYYSTRHFGSYDLDSAEYIWKHAGVDLKLPLGTPFSTIAAGKVYDVRNDSVLGTHVIIEHEINSELYYSIYGHMQTSYVVPNQVVYAGEIIGTVGATATDQPHLHLQVNRNDPEWRSVRTISKEVANIYTVHPIEFIEKY